MTYLTYFIIYIILQNECTCKNFTGYAYRELAPYYDEDYKQEILRGKNADIRNWPFIVAIMLHDVHHCEGTLISRECVVTSAHCIMKLNNAGVMKLRDARTMSLRLGSSNLFSDFLSRNVAALFPHPNFTVNTFDSDVAVIIMSESVSLNNNIQPIEMSKKSPLPVSSPLCHSAGWGYPKSTRRRIDLTYYEMSRTTEFSNSLLYVDVPLIEKSECITMLAITDSMLCTLYDDRSKNECNGVGGASLLCSGKLAGCVTWSMGCHYDNYPSVYTDISHFRPWINEICQEHKYLGGRKDNEIVKDKANKNVLDFLNFIYVIILYVI